MKHKITAFLAAGAFFIAGTEAVRAQRIMENLDRGTLAIRVNNGIYVNWRLPATEWEGVSYNLYRDGVKVNAQPITGATNYLDTSGTVDSQYAVSAIVNGQEQALSKYVSVWKNQYKEITLKERDSSYHPTEACVGDLDGDGEMEIIVKRLNEDYSVENTKYSFIEAYKLDGTFMWEIDLGPNIVMDSNISLGVFDLDGDGKAEIFMRSSEGTIDGTGVMIPDVGDKDGNMIPDGKISYRESIGGSGTVSFQCEGPEFLSVYEGATGKELDRVEFIRRGKVSDWGDNYGHRANKFMFGAPYLDGKNPSIMISRGIYTRTVIKTFDFVDGKIKERWTFDSDNNPKYAAQGNHNYVVADVDGDGCDEIVYGSMTVNNDGTGLYSTELGHGDAIHVGNLDPYRKGIEVFQCHEETYGTSLRAAEDGSILIRHNRTSDTGRCMAGNITDKYPGSEVWGGAQMFSASTRKETTETTGGPENFVIYWDGDLLQEMLDHQGFSSDQGYGTGAIYKFPSSVPYFLANGTASSNWTKGVPMLQADILGDWREEVIWRTTDMKKIRIYSTTDYTDHRIYTLLHDMQYRQAVCWQNCEYNQPPHASFFLGEAEGILLPPPALMRNEKHVYAGSGSVSNSAGLWNKDGISSTYDKYSHLLFDEGGNLSLLENIDALTVTFNSKDDFNLSGQGVLTGNTKVIKQGHGNLSLSGVHSYSGKTEIWDGSVEIDGTISNSPIWMSLHTDLYANGEISKGLLLSYNSNLYVGKKSQAIGSLKISETLTAKEGSRIIISMSQNAEECDIMIIDGKFVVEAGAQIVAEFPYEPEAGKYELFTVTGEVEGDVSLIKAVCEQRTKGTLSIEKEGNKIYLIISDTREPGTIVWSGAVNGTWDFASTPNFSLDGNEESFVTGDNVIFNNNSVTSWITIPEIVYPATVTFEGEKSITLNGDGGIGGDAEIIKKGSGTLTINNLNPYTGKTSIEGGTVNVQNLSTTVRDGALGAYNSNAAWFTISNGARLSVTAKAVETEQPMTIGEGGANVYCGKQLTLRGAIKGTSLTKLASADLCLGGKNSSLDTLIVQAGSVKMLTEEANGYCASNILLKNGTSLYALDNSYSTSNSYYSVIVPEGATATWYLDSRCNYYGKISGKGTLNLNFPYVRSDIEGDATGFEGVINLTGSEARLNTTKGFPNAELNVGSSVSVYSASTGSSSTKVITLYIGALSGSGKLTGGNTWNIGSKNADAQFNGVISAGKVVKRGKGRQIFSSANTYTGGTTIDEGVLEVTNASGSATGTGAVTVNGESENKYGVLDGSGIITGAITVNGHGQINMVGSLYRTLSVKTLNFNSDNAVFSVGVNPTTLKSDKISGTKVTLKGKLIVTRNAGKEFAVGNVFKIIDAATITGAFSSIEGNLPAGLAFDQTMLTTDGTISVVSALGISTVDASEVKVYPTSVSDNLYVKLPQLTDDFNVRIFNMNGQVMTDKIYSGDESEIKLDVSTLARGKYIVRISSKEINVDKTFVK